MDMLPWMRFWGVVFQDERSTPLKINMEPQNGGLENDFPFQLGDFLGSSR